MTSQGHALTQLRRAIRSGDLATVAMLAPELPRVPLPDAVAILDLMRADLAVPDARYAAAARRLLARLAAELALEPEQLARAAALLARDAPAGGVADALGPALR